MKIGVFDSGLGGLVILKSFLQKLPQYDYVYFGDTKNAPYGDKTHDTIYELTRNGVEFLFSQGCSLVILACNSASAQSLRQLQQEWLPKNHPTKKILGVLIPVAEGVVAQGDRSIGVIATTATISSQAYEREIQKLDPNITIISRATPCLVPLVESGMTDMQDIKNCIGNLKEDFKDVDMIVPGCTHYPLIAEQISRVLAKPVYDAPNKIADTLKEYLQIHTEVENELQKNSKREFYISSAQPNYEKVSEAFFEMKVKFQIVEG